MSGIRLWRIWLRLGWQQVQLRFSRSALGVSWTFLNMAVLVTAIGYVYGNLFGQPVRTFLPYLALSVTTWGFLTATIAEGGFALLSAEGYIKQISLPIYVYVYRCFIAVTLTNLITFLVFPVVAWVCGVEFGWGTWWALPGVVLLLSSGLMIVMIMSHLNASYRDASHIVGLVMQILFYVTPVLFPVELLRDRGLEAMALWNPFFHVLEIIRQPLLHARPAPMLSYVASTVFVIGLAGIAALFMRHYGRRIVFAL